MKLESKVGNTKNVFDEDITHWLSLLSRGVWKQSLRQTICGITWWTKRLQAYTLDSPTRASPSTATAHTTGDRDFQASQP